MSRPRLILLNGPPGIGKSTLAARFADDHPGTLNLDIDRLHPFVGGWREDTRTHDLLRPVALAMAAAHLAGGHDVITPQLVIPDEAVSAFARVAAGAGADFREVVLLDDRGRAIGRGTARPSLDAWGRHNRAVIDELGGTAFLAGLFDALTAALRHRPHARLVSSRPGEPDATYATLLDVLSEG